LLGGGDASVSESFLDDDDVGAAGEQPGGVGGTQVVEGDVLLDLRGVDGGGPELGAEVVAGQGRPGAGGEQQAVIVDVIVAMLRISMSPVPIPGSSLLGALRTAGPSRAAPRERSST